MNVSMELKKQQPAITQNKEIQVRNEITNSKGQVSLKFQCPAICGLKDEQFLIQYFLNFDFQCEFCLGISIFSMNYYQFHTTVQY